MKNVILLIIIVLFYSCNSDNSVNITDDSIDPVVSASDFLATINENPETNQIIGVIEGTTNAGTLNFRFDEQSQPGALAIDVDTGGLTVMNPAFFDFELNEEVTATAIVSNGNVEQTVSVSIQILDVFRENDLRLTHLDYSPPYYGKFYWLFNDGRNVLDFENEILESLYVNFGDIGSVYIEVFNDGNEIIEYERYNGQEYIWYHQTLSFTYTQDNRISEVHRLIDVYALPDIIEEFSISYNGNIIEVTNIDTNSLTRIFLNDDGLPLRYEYLDKYLEFMYDSSGNLVSKLDSDGRQFNYTHDTKRNPYLDIAPLNWNNIQTIYFSLLLGNYKPQGLGIPFNHGIWSNTNNISSMEFSYGNYYSYSYSYEYNSDGYPIFKTVDNEDVTLQFEYD